MKDDSKLNCSNCKGNHAACSKSCPVLAKRAQIKKTHVDSLSIVRPASLDSSKNKNLQETPVSKLINDQIQPTILKFLLLLIDILSNFQSIQESIFENKAPLLQLINNYFGESFNDELDKKLTQLGDSNNDDEDDEDSDESDND